MILQILTTIILTILSNAATPTVPTIRSYTTRGVKGATAGARATVAFAPVIEDLLVSIVKVSYQIFVNLMGLARQLICRQGARTICVYVAQIIMDINARSGDNKPGVNKHSRANSVLEIPFGKLHRIRPSVVCMREESAAPLAMATYNVQLLRNCARPREVRARPIVPVSRVFRVKLSITIQTQVAIRRGSVFGRVAYV